MYLSIHRRALAICHRVRCFLSSTSCPTSRAYGITTAPRHIPIRRVPYLKGLTHSSYSFATEIRRQQAHLHCSRALPANPGRKDGPAVTPVPSPATAMADAVPVRARHISIYAFFPSRHAGRVHALHCPDARGDPGMQDVDEGCIVDQREVVVPRPPGHIPFRATGRCEGEGMAGCCSIDGSSGASSRIIDWASISRLRGAVLVVFCCCSWEAATPSEPFDSMTRSGLAYALSHA